MKIKYINIIILSLLSGACVTQSQRSAEYSKICIDAEMRGAIYLAEENCQLAWYAINNDALEPKIKSQRLYDLGRIKRQLNKFSEAEKYIQQALEIEQSVTSKNSPEYGLRLVELSLSIAGQGSFMKAAITLEPVLNLVEQFSPPDKKRTINVLKYFATRLRHTDQVQMANRFDAKIQELL